MPRHAQNISKHEWLHFLWREAFYLGQIYCILRSGSLKKSTVPVRSVLMIMSVNTFLAPKMVKVAELKVAC